MRVGRPEVPGFVVQREARQTSKEVGQDIGAYVKDAAQSLH